MKKVFLTLLFISVCAGAAFFFFRFKSEKVSLNAKRAPQRAAAKANHAQPAAKAPEAAPAAATETLAAVLERIQSGKSADIAGDYLVAAKLAKSAGDDENYMSAMNHLMQAYPDTPQAAAVAPELGDAYAAKNELEAARKMYSFAYMRAVDLNVRRAIAAKLDPICEKLVFSRAQFSEAVFYRVQGGDTLEAVAAKYNCPVRLIQRINNKSDDRLRIGERLKIITGPNESKMCVKVVVKKSEFTMTVYLNDAYLKSYPVAIGKDDSTPTATFRIVERLFHPDWNAPDGKTYEYGSPKNILGDWWLKFNDDEYAGFGIHGTTDAEADPARPETIQKAASAGCIRMFNSDVSELASLAPRGTVVEIRD